MMRSRSSAFRYSSSGLGAQSTNRSATVYPCIVPKLLVERNVDLPWPSPQLHPSTIADDGNQPCRHLRLPSELIQVFISGEKCILDRILCVGRIAQVSISCSVEQRQTTRKSVLQFSSFFLWGRNVEVLFVSDGTPRSLAYCLFLRSGHENARLFPINRKAT